MMIRKDLHDGWTLRFLHGPVPADLPTSIPATVPGTVHTDLLEQKLIPDPYLDLNEAAVQWIGRCDVEYADTFDIDRGGYERVDLVCEGLDTVASLELNGLPLGATRNQHRSFRFDLRTALRETGNDLRIRFDSALDYALQAEQRLGVRPVVGNGYPYNAIRKMACNFGWDWGPVLITAGIWKPIFIHAWSTGRLASVRPVVSVDSASTGRVELHIEVERTTRERLGVQVRLYDRHGREVASAQEPLVDDSIMVSLDVEDVELWWPRGYGEQPLYDVVVVISAEDHELDRWTKSLGFRTVTVESAPDAVGTSFSFTVNGQYVFIKGANWIPDDCFVPRITPERYARSIKDATDVGMNLLWVWGGGIYESDAFYDTCDRVGLLVWQDFAFACAAYSESRELWVEVEAEARENVTRLAPHPSLAIWSGGNENIEGYYHWGWKEALRAGETWGAGYYEKLFPEVLTELDPTRAYIPSSPFNPADAAYPRDPDNGPVHEWEVWNRQDYTHYRENIPRFVAEFGYQGPPAFSTIVRAIHDTPLRPDSPGMVSHQKADHGADKLSTGLGNHLPHPTTFDDWHFATQLNQARAITLGIEHFRSHSPRTAGSIIWQLNDCWPVLSWAAVDGDKHRKPLWYALRAVNADRLIMLAPREVGLALVVSNDSASTWRETIDLRRVSLSGLELAKQSIAVEIEPRSNETFTIDTSVATAGDPRQEVLVASSCQARRAWWYFVDDPDLKLPDLAITAEVSRGAGGYVVEVSATAFVKDLVLNVDRLDPDATVDELFVTLLPGERGTVNVRSDRELDVEALLHHPVLQSVNGLVAAARALEPRVVA
jgi:beta-mannosidase